MEDAQCRAQWTVVEVRLAIRGIVPCARPWRGSPAAPIDEVARLRRHVDLQVDRCLRKSEPCPAGRDVAVDGRRRLTVSLRGQRLLSPHRQGVLSRGAGGSRRRSTGRPPSLPHAARSSRRTKRGTPRNLISSRSSNAPTISPVPFVSVIAPTQATRTTVDRFREPPAQNPMTSSTAAVIASSHHPRHCRAGGKRNTEVKRSSDDAVKADQRCQRNNVLPGWTNGRTPTPTTSVTVLAAMSVASSATSAPAPTASKRAPSSTSGGSAAGVPLA